MKIYVMADTGKIVQKVELITSYKQEEAMLPGLIEMLEDAASTRSTATSTYRIYVTENKYNGQGTTFTETILHMFSVTTTEAKLLGSLRAAVEYLQEEEE